MIPTAFNMLHERAGRRGRDGAGRAAAEPAGDFIRLRAEMDLVIGLTACSAFASNGGSFKPIGYTIDG